MIERAEARIAFPFELEVSEQAQPNKRPIKAVLFRSNVRSIAPPHGSDKCVVLDRSALKRLDLSSLVGLPLHATPNLDGHWVNENNQKVYYPVGTITMATHANDAIIGSGYLWDVDHPEIVAAILEASREGQLAVSWEIVNVMMKEEEDHYRIYSFTPVGWALLRAPFAAYQSLMPALAAIANKEAYDPSAQPLKVLLDDHRLLHAYYATIRRGGTVSGWTLSEIVKLHAAIVDEMILRHVQHRRCDGLSKTLNEESLPLQSFKFFTDEISTETHGVWQVDKGKLKGWLSAVSTHEKIEIDEFPESLPIGLPIAIAVDNLVYAVGAIAKQGNRKFLAIPQVFKKPVTVSELNAITTQWQTKLKFASQVLEELPETVVIPSYIAVTGSSLLTPKSKDLDLLICDNGAFSKLASYFDLDKPLHFTLTDKPVGLAIPVYDLILVKRPKGSTAPLVESEKLVEHETVTVTDVVSFVAARMRSLGDLDIYPQSAFITQTVPLKRGLLFVTTESAEIHTDEGEILDCSFLLTDKPESCISATVEVWLTDEGWSVADCLWWNATKAADLPFQWRLTFARKIAEAFNMPLVQWQSILAPDAVANLKAFVLQDSQAVYEAPRIVVRAAQ